MISITIDGADGGEIRHQMAQMLNIVLVDGENAGRTVAAAPPTTPTTPTTLYLKPAEEDRRENTIRMTAAEAAAAGIEGSVNGPAPTRERGQPSPGKQRRTKAEIAEDEAAEIAEAAFNAANSTAEEQPNISTTPEDRVDPANPEEEAADAADEAAEAPDSDNLTVEHLRQAIGRYVVKFGIAAAQEDAPKITGYKTAPDCPSDKLAEAIKAVETAMVANPYGRPLAGAVGEQKPAATPKARTATKAEVGAALQAYAVKYDGQGTDPNNMPITMIDGPECLSRRFGAGVNSVSKIPATPENYGQALTDIEEMIERNPFDREVKVA